MSYHFELDPVRIEQFACHLGRGHGFANRVAASSVGKDGNAKILDQYPEIRTGPAAPRLAPNRNCSDARTGTPERFGKDRR